MACVVKSELCEAAVELQSEIHHAANALAAVWMMCSDLARLRVNKANWVVVGKLRSGSKIPTLRPLTKKATLEGARPRCGRYCLLTGMPDDHSHRQVWRLKGITSVDHQPKGGSWTGGRAMTKQLSNGTVKSAFLRHQLRLLKGHSGQAAAQPCWSIWKWRAADTKAALFPAAACNSNSCSSVLPKAEGARSSG